MSAPPAVWPCDWCPVIAPSAAPVPPPISAPLPALDAQPTPDPARETPSTDKTSFRRVERIMFSFELGRLGRHNELDKPRTHRLGEGKRTTVHFWSHKMLISQRLDQMSSSIGECPIREYKRS